MIEGIQPIVLVGGASRHFGRDKLREPLGEGWLVDRPIGVLHEVFGPVVTLVGDCHEDVARRADGHLADRYPGSGPLGGIVAGLEAFAGDVFVLPGDVPMIATSVVHRILGAAALESTAWAVIAATDREESCIGVYRRACLPLLLGRLGGTRALRGAIPADRIRLVPVEPALVVNANTPDNLHHGAGGPSVSR